MSEVAAPARERGGLSPGVVAWLVAGAALAFAAFLAALAYQPDLAASADKGAHALSRSPTGYAGVIRLLRADGAVVRLNRRRDPGDSLAADALFVLTPRFDTRPKDVARLARGRRVLLVPAKWITAADPQRFGKVAAVGVFAPKPAVGQIAVVLQGGDPRPPETEMISSDAAAPRPVTLSEPGGRRAFGFTPQVVRPVAQLRTLGGGTGEAMLTDAAGHTLLAAAPGRAAYVLSDPDLIDNQGVADLPTARAAASLLESLADGGPIVFDMTLTGLAGEKNPLKLAFEPPFLPATVSFALAAVLLGLSARSRFGPVRTPVRAYGFGKRALADSAASLLAVAGREPRLAPRYVQIAHRAALAAAGLPSDLPPEAQAETLDRIGEARGAGGWSALAAEARAVRTRAQLMALARRAYDWRTEMTHGRG